MAVDGAAADAALIRDISSPTMRFIMLRRSGRVVLALALALLPLPVQAQSFPVKYDSTASTNATFVNAGYALVKLIFVTNTTTTVYYLKLYDTATTPACNTATVVFKAAVPFAAS